MTVSVLVVEDEYIVAEDIRALLTQAGYRVVDVVKSGDAAIEAAGNRKPDIVLMDIYISGPMNGIEAADRIRQQFGIPVIFVTAYSESQLIDQAKLSGPYGYILKPFDEKDLVSSIEIAMYKHQLDRKLRESEERYRRFVHHFLGIAFRLNSDLTPVFFHGAVEAITGYTEQDFLSGNPSFLGIVHPEDLPQVRETMSEAFRDPSLGKTVEYRIVRKDRGIRWIFGLLQVFPGDYPFIQGACYDITERKAVEELTRSMNEELERRVAERTLSLNNQVQFLQQLVDTIPSPVFYKDEAGRYLGCNKAFEAYFGMKMNEIVGRSDKELHVLDTDLHSAERDRMLLSNRGIQSYRSTFRHSDGSIRDIIVKRATFSDACGKISGFIGVLQDITDMVRAEETLREQERLFREVVQDQTELIVRYRPDWTILFANDAFLAYFSRTAENTIGHIFRPKILPEDEMAVVFHYHSFSPANTTAAIDFRAELPDGSRRFLHWTTRAFFDNDGTLTEYQSTVRAIPDPEA